MQPRNPLVIACHVFNITAQVNQMRRAAEYKMSLSEESKKEVESLLVKGAAVGAGLLALVAGSGTMVKKLAAPAMPSFVNKIATSPVGPFTAFLWAPTTKWALSAINLVDLKKDTKKMSTDTFPNELIDKLDFIVVQMVHPPTLSGTQVGHLFLGRTRMIFDRFQLNLMACQ